LKENNKIPKGFTWTPIFDHLVNDLGLTQTAIIGVIWRYSQMDEKICRASQDSISLRLGLSRQSLNKHIKELIAKGYVIDFSPKLRNRPHFLKLTEKVYKLNKVENVDEETINETETYPTGEVTLLNNEELLSTNEDLLSIFELFGVNNLYMKKDIKKEIKIDKRNISNNSFVDLIIYSDTYQFNHSSQTQKTDDPIWGLPEFINYAFLFNIFEFEQSLLETEDSATYSSLPKTFFHITDKGVSLIDTFMDSKYSKIDWDYLTSVIDFWFWYTIESNDRVENLQQLLFIFKQRNLEMFINRYPEVYRRSPAVQVVTEVVGFDPPDILCPRIFNLFSGLGNPRDIKYILVIMYSIWKVEGNNDHDFGWLFDRFSNEILSNLNNPKKWWFRYVPREM